jgi:hypothetical protein
MRPRSVVYKDTWRNISTWIKDYCCRADVEKSDQTSAQKTRLSVVSSQGLYRHPEVGRMKPDRNKEPSELLYRLGVVSFSFEIIDIILRSYPRVPRLTAMAVTVAIAVLPAYYVPDPIPKVSFLRYAAAVELLVAAVVLELSLPRFLRRFMAVQWAVALPPLLLGMPLYYLPRKLVPGLWNTGAVRLGLGVLVLALLSGGVAAILH